MPNTSQSVQIVRSFVQDIHAAPERVFPLLCPEREKEWLPGWDARMIHSASGVAERGAIFETRHERGLTLWAVTEHDPPRRVAFVRWQPDGLIVHIDIVLARRHEGGTVVGICYTYTAVNETGANALATLTESAWLETMAFWQGSMNEWFVKQRPSTQPHR